MRGDPHGGGAMRLEDHALLDALCGEYLVGTLRGAARRRFERALREEPRVALRLRDLQHLTPTYSDAMKVEPSRRVWQSLEQELGLASYRRPWHRQWGLWAATAASVVLLVAFIYQIAPREALVEIAQLSGKDESVRVSAHRSRDGRTLELRANRTVVASAKQSYEVWLIPAEGGDPISLAVLGSLDAHLSIDEAQKD